ncbi:MAG: hypothetical protein SO165_02240 [Lachnospiraceae bacterium]|nr:hypothetical protein [Lachnospiraceae bacterium]MDY4836564.1 hypothetical protein [Lachnospiraceae bacterium]
MISVLINWSYVFITTYIIGYFTLSRAYRFYKHERHIGIMSSVMAGLAITTAYAGFFSIFHKVGIVANIVMILFCVLFVWLDRTHYKDILVEIKSDNLTKKIFGESSIRIIKVIVFSIFFVAALFFTTEGNFFSDSGYYHEQSIRWIEEFGTVKGSVHILKRLAYNSCYFCQCALYSMRDIFSQSLHCLSGFYGILVMGYALAGFNKSIRTNAIRLAPFVYFILLCSEITSPASDYPLVFSVFYVVIRWFELSDEEEEHYSPYALLSLFVVFLISIKLTVGCLILIVIKPAIAMIKEKRIKEIITSIMAGIIILLPYFIRNYIICGWLIYPFTKIDIFNPDWKLPMRHVQADADEIKVWGRGMGQIGGQVTDSIKVWLPHWWEYMSVPNRMIVASAIIVLSVYLVYRVCRFISEVIRHGIRKTATEVVIDNIDRYIFEAALLFSLLYWFFESPLFRYGVCYIIVAMFYAIGDMLGKAWNKSVIIKVAVVLICVLTMIPFTNGIIEYFKWNYECILYYSDYEYFVMQEDYPRVEYGTTEINGVTFYYPKEELGQIGYHMFPALWFNGTDNVESRGDKITDGYRYKH